MLVIRLQRTGRKGHAQFRVVVQDSRRTPTSGKIVAQLGHYNPHNKEFVVNKEKAEFYLTHGAQPSDKVARLLKADGVKMPKWVALAEDKKRDIKNVEKLRKNQPAAPEVVEPEASEESTAEIEESPVEAEQATTEEPAVKASEEVAETPEADKPVEPEAEEAEEKA